MGIGIRGTFAALCVTLSGRAIMPDLPRDWAHRRKKSFCTPLAMRAVPRAECLGHFTRLFSIKPVL
jgi:hypothetical protein